MQYFKIWFSRIFKLKICDSRGNLSDFVHRLLCKPTRIAFFRDCELDRAANWTLERWCAIIWESRFENERRLLWAELSRLVLHVLQNIKMLKLFTRRSINCWPTFQFLCKDIEMSNSLNKAVVKRKLYAGLSVFLAHLHLVRDLR